MKFKDSFQKLTIKPGNKWFEQLPKLTFPKATPNPDVVLALKAESENLLDSETKLYQKLREIQKKQRHCMGKENITGWHPF
ncbi:hypothetical protein TNCT_253541 [Trichonephila clavata]|uniref:Uncharacterized protein n=1 Tax=Trichonephila clavata TaxID=2740835 RepID=A0A8X6LZ23_TRICU|nr:hypothetical protein TNCT_253541 [Trichonephila clavata]